MNIKVYGVFYALLGLVACHSEATGDGQSEDIRKEYDASSSTPVTVTLLKRRTFQQELICNGIAAASLKSALSFNTSGTVERVWVQDGDWVRRGDTLATLISDDAQMACRSAELNLRRAELALDSRLIEFGFRLTDTARMNQATLRTLCVNTGYAEARINFERARIMLDNCTLRAPFTGRVAQMACVPHEPAPGICCTLLNDRTMDIGFSLLETENDFVLQGCEIAVASYHEPGRLIPGRIRSVSPLIDQYGQIAVKAEVVNSSGLLDGMHVRVVLSKSSDNEWVVPKSAVTLRDNLDVVFKVVDGRSAWTYVHIVKSNSEEHVIEADTTRNARLAEGDTIIVSGHVNMGDNVPVHPAM